MMNIKKDETVVGVGVGARGGMRKRTRFWYLKLNVEVTWKAKPLIAVIIRWILKTWDGRIWNVLILGSAKWRAVVSMAMNLQLL